MIYTEIIIAFAAVTTSIATWLLFVVAKNQLGKMAKISKVDFITRYEKDFYEENEEIICALDYDGIKFVNDIDNPHYELIKEDGNKKTISTCKMDQLFGYFETLGYLEKKKDVDIEYIYEIFGHYAILLWKLLEGDYLIICREKSENSNIYNNYVSLIKRLIIYGKNKTDK
jgi:hypothetical protein